MCQTGRFLLWAQQKEWYCSTVGGPRPTHDLSLVMPQLSLPCATHYNGTTTSLPPQIRSEPYHFPRITSFSDGAAARKTSQLARALPSLACYCTSTIRLHPGRWPGKGGHPRGDMPTRGMPRGGIHSTRGWMHSDNLGSAGFCWF